MKPYNPFKSKRFDDRRITQLNKNYCKGRLSEEEYMKKLKKQDREDRYEYDDGLCWDMGNYEELLSPLQTVERLNKQHQLIQSKDRIIKGQELEIKRLHGLADNMSGVLRELGVYDVYDREAIDEVKMRIIFND